MDVATMVYHPEGPCKALAMDLSVTSGQHFTQRSRLAGQPADSNLHVDLCCTTAGSAGHWLQEGRSTIEGSNFVCLQGNLQPGSECHRQ